MINEKELSLGSRRTTRVAMRTLVRLQIQHQDGSNESAEGYSMLVNKHGARVEIGKPVLEGDTIRQIKVLATGAFGSGKVVWVDKGPNDKGKYEFGVALDEDKNIWGVFFPPDDWGLKSPRKGAVTTNPEFGEAQASLSTNRARSWNPRSANESDVPVASVDEPAAVVAEARSRIEDRYQKTADVTPAPAELQPLSLDRKAMNSPGNGHLATSGDSTSAGRLVSIEGHPANDVREDCPDAARTIVSRDGGGTFPEITKIPPLSTHASSDTTTRLMEIFNDMVGSVLQARMNGLSEWVETETRSHIARVQETALIEYQQRIEGYSNARRKMLEEQVNEIVAQVLEKDAQDFLQSTHQKIQLTHQELLEAVRDQAEDQALELLAAKRDAFLSQLNAMSSEALAGLQKQFQEETLTFLQTEFSEQCQASGKELLAEHLDHLHQNYSQFMKEATGKLEELTNLTQTVIAASIEELHTRSNQVVKEANNKLQQQMIQTANDFYSKILAALSGKLSQKEEECLQKAQNEMDEAIQNNLHRFREVLGESIMQVGRALQQEH